MSKISKFVKVDKNVLIEYTYNDSNLISEGYNVLINTKDKKSSYMASDTSATGNDVGNQLFRIDNVNLKYGKIHPENYSFLQIKNFSSGTPIKHDVLKLHFPINWTFGEYLGLYIRIYTYDSLNFKTYDLSNFYFDMTDISQQYLMNFTSPPLLFQEKLWGKYIKLEIPAINEISSQLTITKPKENSINANLTNGTGLSLTSPIFLDFHFIDNIQTINAITTYRVTPKVTTSFSQTPEFQRLGLVIKNSSNGDFFEIYGTYNDSLSGFNQFMEDSYTQGHKYYVQYSITLYEQNIRGKTSTFTMTDSFNETIEFRPIIKTSTTTAIIDVEMRVIDLVDESSIIRRASYGMLQDEVAKYSSKLMKINLKNASKPKIYAIKNAIDPSTIGLANSQGRSAISSGVLSNGFGPGGFGKFGANVLSALGLENSIMPTNFYMNPLPGNGQQGGGLAGNGSSTLGFGGSGTGLASGSGGGLNGELSNGGVQTVKVPFPVLIDKYNIVGKSENALFNSQIYYGITKMQIVIYPFDNIIKFVIAAGDLNSPTYFDMTSLGEIKLVFKNDVDISEFDLYTETDEINLKLGQLVFRIQQNKFNMVKKIYDSGINIFYITSSNQKITTVVYTGLFKIFDNRQNVSDMNAQAAANSPSIIQDPRLPKETAVVTRQLVNKPPAKGTG